MDKPPQKLSLKRDTPTDIVAAIENIEDQADLCSRNLKILRQPSNVAIWGLLTGGILMIEAAVEQFGENNPNVDSSLVNAGKFMALAINWIEKHGKPADASAARRWQKPLPTDSLQALQTAIQYQSFEFCFPMWHKDRSMAQLLSPTRVRFTVPGGTRERQVSAWHKTMRPLEGVFYQPRPQKENLTNEINEQFRLLVDTSKKRGAFGFDDSQHLELWRSLLPQYEARASGIIRRPDYLSLGNYKLGEFKRFYAALMAICSAKEYFCFLWNRRRGYFPFTSAVMVRTKAAWAAILSDLSGLSLETCQLIIDDLTFGALNWRDVHVQPFVPLGTEDLAVAYPFPLASNIDENILRVLSITDRDVFNAVSGEKEALMREEIVRKAPQYSYFGPINIKNPKGEIDIVIADEASSTVVVAELKWIRKPSSMFDRRRGGFLPTGRITLQLTINWQDVSMLTTTFITWSSPGITGHGRSLTSLPISSTTCLLSASLQTQRVSTLPSKNCSPMNGFQSKEGISKSGTNKMSLVS